MQSTARSLLRSRNGHDHSKVTFVELFFDLVFVFAVTQLSHSLIEHFSPLGAVQTLLLMLAVWWVWIFTSWVTNWLDPEKLPVRLLLLIVMLAGLLMSAAIPEAFESAGLLFGGAYAAIQVGRTLFVLWALADDDKGLTRNFQRILVWLAVPAVFWVLGGLADGGERLAWWSLALGLEYVSPSLGFWVPGLGRSRPGDWNVEGHHLSERCALFVIIALGESILVTGATFSALAWTFSTVAAFVVSFVGSLAMWWLYFDTSADAGSRTISTSAEPGRLARLAYTYIHLFIIAGIIVAAVADEFVLAHPAGRPEPKVAITVLGGAALYLLGNTLFKWAIADRLPISPLIAIAALALLIPISSALSPLVLSTAATLVLVATAAWEARVGRWCPGPTLGDL
ncbi:low temperature requirement protein A [Crenobacter cavernae]|uniref:Low temperature requirement protein A n=1 Tax=Crenobacter cavernae TaxID=2290923 RepID=A0ABY0FFY5_9NEIS|nr:low temperature requirement protein A [Crenobacter cavernae]RXZ45306.1 hypothetical protein EBB06_00320 [Crenobacter cavernae]